MALRRLSVIYLAAASSFAVAATLAQHPALNTAVHSGARLTMIQGEASALALYRDARNAINPPVQVAQAPVRAKAKSVAIMKAKPAPLETGVTNAPAQAVAQLQTPKIVAPPIAPSAPALLPPTVESAPTSPPADNQVASIAQPAPKFTLAPQVTVPTTPPSVDANTASALPPDHQPSPPELVRVTQHMRDSLTAEMLTNFDLFLFVSKAEGSSAVGQRMYVFQKQDSGDLVLLHNWPVSTGREKVEFAPDGTQQPSFTPAGYYEIDAQRMYVHHFSGQWKQPMPYAMFFNWENHGYQTGLAIHGATGDDIGLLGTRASAGCVRLSPENARVLFSLIKNNYKGLMPKFAYDKRTATMSNNGVLLHTTDGRLEMAEGYKVLVFIENYNGENVVAALF